MSPVETPAPPAVAVLRAEHVTKTFGGLYQRGGSPPLWLF